MGPARVVRGHPPEGARAAAPRVGWEEQAAIRQGELEVREHEARLDRGLQVRAVDLDDLAHEREGHDDAALCRDGTARLAGPRATRHDGRAGLGGDAHRRDDVRRRSGHDDDVRTPSHPQRPERRVVGVRLERRGIVDHAVARHGRAQSLDDAIARLEGHAVPVS